MFPQSTPADPTQDPRATRARRYLEVLDQMVELGAELLQDLRPAEAQPAPLPERAQTYDRTTRAIRLCMLLAEKFEQALAAPGQRQARRATARARVARQVEDNIARTPCSPATKEGFTAELHERLDRPETIADLENRPFREIVVEILRDFGFRNAAGGTVWPRRTPEDLEILYGAAARPPSPDIEAEDEHPQDDPLETEPFDDDLPTNAPEQTRSRRHESLMQWALERADDG